MKRTPQPAKPDRAARAKRKPRTIVIGGVEVTLHPVRGRGNLPASMIKRIIREALVIDRLTHQA